MTHLSRSHHETSELSPRHQSFAYFSELFPGVQLTAGLSQCERSCQSKSDACRGAGQANRRCDCDGYRPDTLGVRISWILAHETENLEFFCKRANVQFLCPRRAVLVMHSKKRIGYRA